MADKTQRQILQEMVFDECVDLLSSVPRFELETIEEIRRRNRHLRPYSPETIMSVISDLEHMGLIRSNNGKYSLNQ